MISGPEGGRPRSGLVCARRPAAIRAAAGQEPAATRGRALTAAPGTSSARCCRPRGRQRSPARRWTTAGCGGHPAPGPVRTTAARGPHLTTRRAPLVAALQAAHITRPAAGLSPQRGQTSDGRRRSPTAAGGAEAARRLQRRAPHVKDAPARDRPGRCQRLPIRDGSRRAVRRRAARGRSGCGLPRRGPQEPCGRVRAVAGQISEAWPPVPGPGPPPRALRAGPAPRYRPCVRRSAVPRPRAGSPRPGRHGRWPRPNVPALLAWPAVGGGGSMPARRVTACGKSPPRGDHGGSACHFAGTVGRVSQTP